METGQVGCEWLFGPNGHEIPPPGPQDGNAAMTNKNNKDAVQSA